MIYVYHYKKGNKVYVKLREVLTDSPFSLTWFNLNANMDNRHMPSKVCYEITHPFLAPLGMSKDFHPKYYKGFNYLSILKFKLSH